MSVKMMLLVACAVCTALSTACETGPGLEKSNRLPIPWTPADITENKPIPRENTTWWGTYHQMKMIQAQDDYEIVFIGDSITDYWLTDGAESWKQVTDRFKAFNLGVGGDLTSMVIWRLLNGGFPDSLKPRYAVLMIGTNNGYYAANGASTPENIAAGIGRIIEIINDKSPETKIILLSILPRGDNNQDTRWRVNDRVNNIIKNYDGHCGVRYFDLGQYYANGNGTLKTELFKDDKLHLSLAGYYLWWDKLKELF
jgi:lysophospholipase L1-like esterase